MTSPFGKSDAKWSLLEAALGLAAEGISVTPLAPRSQRPLFPEYSLRTRNTDQIKRLWSLVPQANVGVLSTRDSFFSVILDGEEGEATAQRFDLAGTRTRQYRRYRWRHLWFRHPRSTIVSRHPLPGIWLLRDDNASIEVAPPSVSPTGESLAWKNVSAEILPLPAELVAPFTRRCSQHLPRLLKVERT